MRSWLLALITAAALLPTAANAWWDEEWAYRKPITLNTTPQGANVDQALTRFPVLVRLDSGNFTFEDAKPDGSDIRFIGQDDKTPLPFHVESWDPQTGLATVWVDSGELPANSTRPVYMYFGNPEAPSASNPAQTFAADYRAVYHFDPATGAPADSTANRNVALGEVPRGAGFVGRGGQFDGSTTLTLPASDSLNFQPAPGFTFESWVRPGADGSDGVIFRAGALTVGLAAGVPYVEVSGTRAAAGAAIGTGWSHVAATGDGTAVRLFVNGVQAAEARAPLPAISGSAVLGEGFTGAIDEVRLSAAPRPAAWFTATFQSQGQGGKLLAYGEDEEPGGEPNPLLVLFPKLEPIDRVVIAFLAIMLVIAIWVMVSKSAYVADANKANRAFNARFRKLSSDELLSGQFNFDAGEQRRFQKAPLYRLFEVGMEEYAARRDEYRGRPLSEETVEAMRAAIDEQQVVENEKLDRWIVLLTIAIAGGPFIGLFGTVVGVMFVFASIAAAGDVNINAIAPGVAAALMATVAGLFVAIPALFGYNYLSSRIAALSSEMSIFSERLITRLAESQHRAAHMRHAAE